MIFSTVSLGRGKGHASVIEPAEILSFVTRLLHPVMHFKRAYSIGLAVVGAMHADRLSVAAVGRALARPPYHE